jgi:hypothetical protein
MSEHEDDRGIHDIDDIKAKMREALERKKANDQGVEHHDHKDRGHAEHHGPALGKRMHRRKSG